MLDIYRLVFIFILVIVLIDMLSILYDLKIVFGLKKHDLCSVFFLSALCDVLCD